VPFRCPLGDHQSGGDLPIAKALGHEPGHLPLALGQD
jgi:hypothetical protein